MSKRSSSRKKSKRRAKRHPRPAGARTTQPEVALPTEAELAAEYQYVIEDLKRIGIIAGALIAGLVILSFFL